MTSHQQSTHKRSATIVPFPVGGRAGLVRVAVERGLADVAVPAVDWRGWYHGEAVADSDKPEHH